MVKLISTVLIGLLFFGLFQYCLQIENTFEQLAVFGLGLSVLFLASFVASRTLK
ncbi:hypothetical protein ALC152_05140 [Arcobacter sp. 15-2]|uniref:hypothetical protein n=1 Tax=Arcobacter sp. 15-2 TaxID=3374109 RepID=UPI00399D2D16